MNQASPLKQQVHRFYERLWDAQDHVAIPSVLHPDCRFRGSLGQEKVGHAGFADYVEMLHTALGNYRCTILELVEEEKRVFAKMSFSGIHQADFMGRAPTGKRVTWQGAALFSFEGSLVKDLWVLGDLKGLDAEFERNQEASYRDQ